jgi:hypothetical protein
MTRKIKNKIRRAGKFPVLLFYLLVPSSSFLLSFTPNVNTWGISLNKDLLMHSSDHKMGGTTEVKKTRLKRSDTLSVYEFWCVYSDIKAQCSLSLKNDTGVLIAENTMPGYDQGLFCFLPVSTFFSSAEFQLGKILQVFFTIKEKGRKNYPPKLIGKIKLK